MFIVEGFKIGAALALPVGPVVILLLCMAILRSMKDFLVAQFLVGLAVGTHFMVAMSFHAYIRELVERFPVELYAMMGFLVLFSAWRLYATNQKIRYGLPRNTKLWGPGVLSLLCPFTTVLVINLMINTPSLCVDLELTDKLCVALGAILGSMSVYCSEGFILFLLRKKADSWMKNGVMYTPLILVFYGLSSLHQSLQTYKGGSWF
ncbi:MAG: hypothetical protein OXC30_05790 [Alphaproteobacteria bacterium]|nr:hypothetical protein [Alphaproteobacteria bacterium]